MYLKYFGLKAEPFSTTPDPSYLYMSNMHREALDRLVAAVQSRKGINAIVGEPGLGKSTLIRAMLSGFSKQVHYAWVFNTTLTARELIKYICRDFGFKPKSQDLTDLLMELYDYLIARYEEGKYAVLIIDEAQNLKPEVLEEVRQLSNLETSQRKLLQVILSGQPQLETHLQHPRLHQLRQRISMKAVLHRMTQEDTKNYIRFRLEQAGAPREDIFTDAAMDSIHEISDGIPRLVNQTCDNALMTAQQEKIKQLDSKFIQSILDRSLLTPATVKVNTSRGECSVSENTQSDSTPIVTTESGGYAPSWEKTPDNEELFDVLDLGQLTITD
jgi:general secretion pathway protein A